MTTPIHISVTLNATSGIPEDAVVNTFNFIGPDISLGTCTTIQGYLNAFYNVDNPPSGPSNLANYLSGALARTGNGTIRFYDASPSAGGALGSPKVTLPLQTLGPMSSGAQPLPNEVSVCLSFAADYTGAQEELGDTRPRGRRRGRIYIGPLIQGSVAVGSFGHAVVNGVLSDTMIDAAKLIASIPGIPWAVWSRTDGLFRAVHQVWVDNAFDTQRRRGEEATGRTTSVITTAGLGEQLEAPALHLTRGARFEL